MFRYFENRKTTYFNVFCLNFSVETKIKTLFLISFFNLLPKCHFVFFIIWNTKLEIKFWFLFLYWNWDPKHETNWFFDFQNNKTLKFKVRFLFFILIWKTKNQICLNKYLMKLVTRSHYAIIINKYKRIKRL